MREMKDSGIYCIGIIPKNWMTLKVLYVLAIPITDGPHTTPTLYDSGIPFVSAEAVTSGHIDFNHIRGFISESFYKECCKKYIPRRDDIYMVKSGATTGNVAKVETDDIFTIWSPLAVLRADENIILAQFLYYSIVSSSFGEQVMKNWSFGTQQNIGMRTIEKLKICLPPKEEQSRIACFLDNKCSEINSIVSAIQTQLETLKQYKKSVITEAVTKGLNPNVEMKDSGDKEFQYIPEHWSINKLKYVGSIHSGEALGNTKLEDEGPYPVYGGGKAIGMYSKYNTNRASILIGRVGVNCGCITVINDKVWATDNALVYTPKENVRYFYYVLLALNLAQMKSSTAQPLIAGGQVLRRSFPCPNSLEQIEIARFLDDKCSEIDIIISHKQKQIETLEAYKKSLIYEYVTGKKEVVNE